MMSTLTTKCLLVVLTLFPALQNAFAEDPLFSDVEINSVFAGESTSADTKAETQTTTVRVRSVEHLGRLLRIEGFGFEKVGSRTYSATTEFDDWTFPTLVTLSEDRKRIGLILGLVRYEKAADLPRETMQRMLIANQATAPCLFSFNEERSRTELVLVIENSDVDSGRLADELTRLKKAAQASVGVWSKKSETVQDTNVATISPEQNKLGDTDASPQPLSVASLIGRWKFAKSATEAFALALTTDGKFTLVQVANGTPVTSRGTYSLADATLKLSVPNGLTLSGPVKLISTEQFQFTPNASTNALVFSRAK